MRVVALEYHDVVESPAWDQSGFTGAGANSYKVSTRDFEEHLRALADIVVADSRGILDLLADDTTQPRPHVIFTFDDGGVTAFTEIAPRLERHGRRGHFFIATDRIGTPGFLTAHQLCVLRDRGHIVGTHSCSHPLRMSDLSNDELEREWRGSVAALSEILGEPVTVGSLPGGALSEAVAQTAAAAGLKILFTSEPVVSTWAAGECTLIGRYTVRQTTSTPMVLAAAMGARLPWILQWTRWNALKVTKAAAGPSYLTLRRWLLG